MEAGLIKELVPIYSPDAG